jgi:hypothetical protein
MCGEHFNGGVFGLRTGILVLVCGCFHQFFFLVIEMLRCNLGYNIIFDLDVAVDGADGLLESVLGLFIWLSRIDCEQFFVRVHF